MCGSIINRVMSLPLFEVDKIVIRKGDLNCDSLKIKPVA